MDEAKRRGARVGPVRNRGVLDPAPDRGASFDSDPGADSDETEAAAARSRYRRHGPEPLPTDGAAASVLLSGETLLASRGSVGLETRRSTPPDGGGVEVAFGQLYVTNWRLVHVGAAVQSFCLEELEDAAVSGRKLLLIFRSGVGAALDSDRPLLLRVQIANARAASGSSPGQPSSR